MKSAEQTLPFPLTFLRLPSFDLWRILCLIFYVAGFNYGYIFLKEHEAIFIDGKISMDFLKHAVVYISIFIGYAYYIATISIRNLVIGVSKRWRLVFSDHVNHSLTLIVYHGRNHHDRAFYNYIPGRFFGKWTCSSTGDESNNPKMIFLHPIMIGFGKATVVAIVFFIGIGISVV